MPCSTWQYYLILEKELSTEGILAARKKKSAIVRNDPMIIF